MVINQYDVFLITLDPALGAEIKKSRPCVILSPDEMNHHLVTVMVAPMTTKFHAYPTRIQVTFARQAGWIVLDQIRTVDRRRLIKRLGRIEAASIASIKSILQKMLVD
jgi:mRNA interferase MazF